MYRLKDNDIIKPLPILRKDNTLEPLLYVEGVFLDNKMIYDISGKRYLSRMLFNRKLSKECSPRMTPFKRTFACIYHNDKINFIKLPNIKILNGKVNFESTSDFKLDNNTHLHIKINPVETPSGVFDSFYKSILIEKEWIRPNINLNDFDDVKLWIKLNQPYYLENMLEGSSIFRNLDIIYKHFDESCLSDLIASDRNNLIESIIE